MSHVTETTESIQVDGINLNECVQRRRAFSLAQLSVAWKEDTDLAKSIISILLLTNNLQDLNWFQQL